MKYLFGYGVENVPRGTGGEVKEKVEIERPVRFLQLPGPELVGEGR